jgi:hypothetical protein
MFFHQIYPVKKHLFMVFFTWSYFSPHLVLIHHLAKCYGNAENRI